VVVALGQRLNSYLVQTIVRWLIIRDKWHSRLAEIETGQQTTPDIASLVPFYWRPRPQICIPLTASLIPLIAFQVYKTLSQG
jgi:hypothetical protein